eukprot:1194620-Prorocentrum_minimum.AAC.2
MIPSLYTHLIPRALRPPPRPLPRVRVAVHPLHGAGTLVAGAGSRAADGLEHEFVIYHLPHRKPARRHSNTLAHMSHRWAVSRRGCPQLVPPPFSFTSSYYVLCAIHVSPVSLTSNKVRGHPRLLIIIIRWIKKIWSCAVQRVSGWGGWFTSLVLTAKHQRFTDTWPTS